MNKFEVVKRFDQVSPYDRPSLPKRATSGAAGYDFEVAEDTFLPSYANLIARFPYDGSTLFLEELAQSTKNYDIKPTLVPTGIKCQLDDGYYLELSVRSSLPLKHWIILANGVGIIDSDYYNNESNDGEIMFQLINLSPYNILLKKGDRIGQGIIKQYSLVEGDSYYTGEKRKGGFGSTSKIDIVNLPYLKNGELPIVKTIEFEPSEFPDNPLPITCTTSSNVKSDDDYIAVSSNHFDSDIQYINNTKTTVESEILNNYYVKYENEFSPSDSNININLNFTDEEIKNLPNSLV